MSKGEHNFCILPDLIYRRGDTLEDRPAIILGNERAARRQLSYRELATRIKRIASGLAALGVEKRKRVGALLPNGIEFIELWLATVSQGATFVPFNTALKGALLRYQMKDSGIDVLTYD